MRALLPPLIALLAASACAGPAPAAGPAATDHVDLPRSYKFAPADIVVNVGTTVTWTNSDQFTHSIRLLDGNTVIGLIHPGEKVTHLFDKAGTYRYDCSLHPQNMKGTVTVR